MRFIKRFFCTTLCIIILSLSIGTRYFDANHMENVEATAEVAAVGLSLSAMYAICFYVGTVVYANAPIEMNSLSDEQIVSMGYSTISYINNHAMLNSIPGFVSAPNYPLIGFMDKAGQSVVFSNEAAKTIAATSLLLIMMGANSPDNDNDDDGNDNENDDGNNISVSDDLIKMAKSGKDLFACCSTGFAALLGSVIREQYDKYVNGEESIYSIELEQQFFTEYDLQKQWSGESYTISGSAHHYQSNNNITRYFSFEGTASTPVAVLYNESVSNFSFYTVNSRGETPYISVTAHITDYSGAKVLNYDRTYFSFSSENLALNVPIFTNIDSLKSYLKTGQISDDVLNYTKSYRIADWVQDDWAGILKDPLTGLNALGNMANIARHQGLNALGNEIDTDAFNDYLRDYFANTNPDEFPLPTPNPLKVPILWPSGVLDPETSIDPSRNPAILPDPSIKPEPDPGVKPDPGPGVNPGPGVDPDPGTKPDPDVVELPADELVPSITDSFGSLNIDLRNKFPFCIPWDLYYLLTFLSGLSDDSGISTYSDDHGGGGSSRDPTDISGSGDHGGGGSGRDPAGGSGGGGHSRDPVEKKNGAPVFRLPIVIERYGIEEYIIVDLSPFNALSKISRLLFTLMFVYTLINWTVKIVSVRKDD